MGFRLRWTAKSTIHISRHGLFPGEVEEALQGRIYKRRSGNIVKVIGRSGRGILIVVLTPSTDRPGISEVVTARPATWAEKRLFLRRRK